MESKRPLRVFLCSTKLDLEPERQTASKVIQLSHNDEISMELFGAQPNAPIETCLKSVERCDLMIVIVAFRYGRIVPGRRISFSEAEYRHGRKLGKPCLVYMKQRKPKNPKFRETDPRQRERLERWKATLRHRHTYYDYCDITDLAMYLGSNLPSWVNETASVRDTSAEDSSYLAREQNERLREVWVYAPHPLETIPHKAHDEIRQQVGKNLISGVKYVYFVESSEGITRIARLARLLAENSTLPFGEALNLIKSNIEVCVLDRGQFMTHYTVHFDAHGGLVVYQSLLEPERKDRIMKLSSEVAHTTYDIIRAKLDQMPLFDIDGVRVHDRGNR